MSTWLLIRHGRTASNQRRVLGGPRHEPLNAEGRWQAIAAGKGLRRTPAPPLLLGSTALRVRQTAAAISAMAGWPPPHAAAWNLHPALDERDLGAWFGCSYDDLRASGAMAALLRWDEAPPGGGESLAQLTDRVLGLLATLPDLPGVIVGHAGSLRVLQGLAGGVPLDALGTIKVANAVPVAVQLPPGGWAALRPLTRR